MTAALKPVAQTAAFLLIGNELLSGKVKEANLVPLAKMLRARGVVLARVVAVADVVDVIADEVRALASSHDWLFTSGGVGPTHDDVTLEGVAKAFHVPAVPHPDLVALLQQHYAERLTDGHLRMAIAPEGASLEVSADIRWPTIRMHNTWVLPGVPEAFRMKLEVIARSLPNAVAFISRAVYTNMDEGPLVPLLDAIVARFPDVEVGSYPKWFDATYKTKLTFDGRDPTRVEAAVAEFVASLPGGEPQRIE